MDLSMQLNIFLIKISKNTLVYETNCLLLRETIIFLNENTYWFVKKENLAKETSHGLRRILSIDLFSKSFILLPSIALFAFYEEKLNFSFKSTVNNLALL